jgi:hypothetical protein
MTFFDQTASAHTHAVSFIANDRSHKAKMFAALLVLVGHCFASYAAVAEQSQDCKQCREDYAACVKAHTQGACKTNYDICMNHCQKK